MSSGAAINLRQKFYRFRQLLSESGHPHAAGALSLTLTIRAEGPKTFLCFNQSPGLAAEAMKQLGTRPPTAPQAPANDPSRIHSSDAMEELLENMLKPEGQHNAAGAEAQESTKAPCVHEWDKTESFCLRCQEPKP